MMNSKDSVNIHKSAEVYTDKVGAGTTIWQYSVILKGASIGENCNINCHTFIENDVSIGHGVTVKSGVYIWDGITIEDHVFIGPNVTFTNDQFPRSKVYPEKFQKIIIRNNASIGANATILGGIEIGRYALIGAGSVVTKSVPAHALIKGNPGLICGWVDESGNKLVQSGNEFISGNGNRFKLVNNTLIKI